MYWKAISIEQYYCKNCKNTTTVEKYQNQRRATIKTL